MNDTIDKLINIYKFNILNRISTKLITILFVIMLIIWIFSVSFPSGIMIYYFEIFILLYFIVLWRYMVIYHNSRTAVFTMLLMVVIFLASTLVKKTLFLLAFPLFYAFVESGSDCFNYRLNFLISAIPFLSTLFSLFLFSKIGFLDLCAGLIFIAGVFLIVLLMFEVPEGRFEIPVYNLIKDFIIWKLTFDKSYLEKDLERYGKDETIEFNTLIFLDKNLKQRLSLLISNIHLGPFGNIGSSNFLVKLEDYIRNVADMDFLFLRSYGSHETNVVSEKIASKLVRDLTSEITKIEPISPNYIKIKRPVEIKEGKIRCVAFYLSGKILYFIEKMGESTADIPKSFVNKLNLNDNEIIVNSNNSFVPNRPCTWSNYDLETMRKCLDVLREKLDQEKEYYSVAEYYVFDKSSLFLMKEDILDLGIRTIVFRSKDFSVALVSIDSSNIERLSRDYLEDFLGQSFDYVLVTSTDNHMFTAINMNNAYIPAFTITNVSETIKLFDNLQLYLKYRLNYCYWKKIVFRYKCMSDLYKKLDSMLKYFENTIKLSSFIFIVLALLLFFL